ncbi:MAG: alpha/beta fold hydrolase [Frankiaceae bacterium]
MTRVTEVRGRLELPAGELFVRQWSRAGGEDDPPLLAVHHLGISGSSLHFAEVAPLLAAGHGARVIAPDLPGFGGSPARATAEGYRPDALAELLEQLLDRLAPPPAGYLGLSWGATIGCHLAARAAGRLGALVLLDGGHVDAVEQPGFEVGASYESRVRAAASQLGAFRFRRLDDALNAVSDDYPRWTPELEASWKAGLRFSGGRVRPRLRADVYAAAVHGLAAAPPSTTWAAIAAARLPVLLVTSDETVERRGSGHADGDAGEGGAGTGAAATGEGGAGTGDAAQRRERHRRARERFAAAVPQADVRVAAGQRADLVAGLGPQLVALVGDWLRSVGAVGRVGG